MKVRSLAIVIAAAGISALAATTSYGSTSRRHHEDRGGPARHVLLLSVDGLHQSDLDWWVSTHPASSLARLVHRGVSYTNAKTPLISDSFPGLIGQVTGGNPRSTGIYYDDSWNRALLPPGSPCTPGQTTGRGTEVTYFEALAKNLDRLDSGFGLPNLYAGLPASIMSLPGDIATVDTELIDTKQLPVDPATCKAVYPHSYLRVNTIFEVAHQAGLRTAWSDKHAAYELVAGPSGKGVDDLFLPEINSSATDPALPAGAGPDWTKNNADTQRYDSFKVQAILNEIDGKDHSGATTVGTPALFGMNFQSVSTAQKLPTSPLAGVGMPGGYVLDHGTWVPGPVLVDALGFVDTQVGRMLAELAKRHLLSTTALVLSAKHGQSPIETTRLKRIDPDKIVGALNAAWQAAGHTGDLVLFSIDDDAMYLWLSDRSAAARSFAKSFLLSFGLPASANAATDYAGNAIAFTASGLASIHDGTAFLHVRAGDARVPDLIGVVQHGVVYTGGKGKISEHGGSDPQDRHVPIVVFGAGVDDGGTIRRRSVRTTQIAPTILTLLGLDPHELGAVQIEHTRTLPGL